ncbi:ribosomal RNA small subunit methyltransferase D [Clostridiales bacterium]|nr:16S rRNA (guanine(966)-N(2))-methyltransferase RsmD [Clostridiales bacterium]GFI55019.1 ribosomal RNA small subunit methyltransferase D [Clostridiales bacterium]
MRIITGSARGIQLESLPGENTRPTTDRVKEALFSMIQFEIEGRRVLDLFGGSGQLGLEALSRGAQHCVFIDAARAACDIITANAKKCKLFDRCRISTGDYASFLRSAAEKEQFDIIFLDPPYDSEYLAAALTGIAEGGLLANGGKIVCETDNGALPASKRLLKDEAYHAQQVRQQVFGGDDALQARFAVLRSVLYGRTRITLLECANGPEDEE